MVHSKSQKSAGDPDGFQRQRKMPLTISLLSLLLLNGYVKYGDSGQAANLVISIENPVVIPIMLGILWLYFFYRFFQFSRELQYLTEIGRVYGNFKVTIATNFCRRYLLDALIKQAEAQYNGKFVDRQATAGTVSAAFDGRMMIVQCNPGQMHPASPNRRSPPNVEIERDQHYSAWFSFLAVLRVLADSRIGTDYVLPIFVGLLPVPQAMALVIRYFE